MIEATAEVADQDDTEPCDSQDQEGLQVPRREDDSQSTVDNERLPPTTALSHHVPRKRVRLNPAFQPRCTSSAPPPVGCVLIHSFKAAAG